jgi:hypothetical protein
MKLAKEALGFSPSCHIEHGIEKFTSWVKQHAVSSSGYENSIQEMKMKGLLK